MVDVNTGDASGPVFLAQRRTRADVEELMDLAGFRYLSSQDYSGAPSAQLGPLIERCSAVIAFIEAVRPPAGVLLEIGAGLGARLPVVLVLAPKVRQTSLPPALRELQSMRLPAPDSQDGADRLRSLVETARRSLDRGTTPFELPEGSSQAERRAWVDESEREVADTLEALGAQLVGYQPPNRRGTPDMAAWLPAMTSAPFNPVLVEVAGRMADPRAKEAQLRSYMEASDALVGLLVLQGSHEATWRIMRSGAVLIVGIDDLAALDQDAFEGILVSGRNRLFHAR